MTLKLNDIQKLGLLKMMDDLEDDDEQSIAAVIENYVSIRQEGGWSIHSYEIENLMGFVPSNQRRLITVDSNDCKRSHINLPASKKEFADGSHEAARILSRIVNKDPELLIPMDMIGLWGDDLVHVYENYMGHDLEQLIEALYNPRACLKIRRRMIQDPSIFYFTLSQHTSTTDQ